jgi:hypothetical protein
MAMNISRITHDLDYAVDCFGPVLQSLQIKEKPTGIPIFLSIFPSLRNIDKIDKWSITVLQADLKDSTKAKFVSQYRKKSGTMNCFIILDKTLYLKIRVSNETRKIVITHMFCHFLAFFFASITNNENIFNERLKERLFKNIDSMSNEKVLELYQFLDKIRPQEDFAFQEQTRDEHFRLGIEQISMEYADLFKNLLLPRKMFDEYFSKEDREKVRELFHAEKHKEIFGLLNDLAKNIAREEWLPENFAVNQVIYIFSNFYINKL